MNPLIRFKKTRPLAKIAFAVTCCGLLPMAWAVVPPPDGGYTGFNTAEGQKALFSLTTGVGNTAVGWLSLFSDIDGSFNTAIGAGTLLFNVGNGSTDEGIQNTAIGTAALLSNSTGSNNTAVGAEGLLSNTTGANNTAMGSLALNQNIDGSQNNAFGYLALGDHTTGNYNNAVGTFALTFDQNGVSNNAFGNNALAGNVNVNSKTAMGHSALVGCAGSANTAIGAGAGANVSAGSFNVYLGVGLAGIAGEVGHTYISNIQSTILNGGGTDTVTVDLNTGLLGHLSSFRRYKEDIKPMDNASKELYRLKPVSFHYKKEFDKTQSPAFGLIAEGVAEVNPGLVAHDAKGRPESVHYEMVNAMLLNEFLKEHPEVQELKKEVAALTAGLQKMSAEIELSKTAPRTVLNDQ